MSRRRVFAAGPALVLVAVLGCGLAGCGGQSSPSMTQLRARASRICSRTLTQSARIKPPSVPSQTAAFLRRGIVVLRPELAALRLLRPPQEQSTAYAVALRAEQRELDILSASLRDLDRGADPLAEIKTLEHRLGAVEADGAAAWRALEIPACANR